jgi:VWFA-related protein
MKPGSRAVVAVLLARTALGQEPSAVPAFPTRADASTADVLVLDKQDRPVRGLRQEDFTLLADGKPQSIVGFEARELATTAASPATTVGDERVASNVGGTKGRTFVFLIDDLCDRLNVAKRHHQLQEAKKTIARWVREKAQPADELTLTTVSGAQMWSDRIDRGRADLLAVLDRVRIHLSWERIKGPLSTIESSRDSVGARSGRPGEATDQPASNPDLLGGLGQRIAARTQGGLSGQELAESMRRRTGGLLGATEWLSKSLTGVRGRKSIVIFSDGIPNSNDLSLFDSAVDASQRANTAVYFVDVKGLGAPALFRAEDRNGVMNGPDGRPESADLGARSMYENYVAAAGLEMVALNTGGTTIRDTNDLLGGVDRIAEESSTYYLLGYQPEKEPDGKWHKLEVKVARPGLKVRTRRGYQASPAPAPVLAPPVTKDKKSAKEKGRRRPLDRAVLTSGAGDAVPLRLASYVLGADKGGLARVLVVLELDTSRVTFHREGKRQTGAVDLTLIAINRDSERTFPLDERVRVDLGATSAGGWMTLTRELRLSAGVAQVRALVRDVASGLGGTVTQRLEVPRWTGPSWLRPW